MNLDGIQVVANKIDTKLYYMEEFELRLVYKLIPNGTTQWTPDDVHTVQNTYTVRSLPSIGDGMESSRLVEDIVYHQINVMDSLRSFAENARINSTERLNQFL